MNKSKIFIMAMAATAGSFAMAADVSSSMQGTVKKIDKEAKTAIVATGGGIERTFHYTDRTVVQGLADLQQDSREALQGLTNGADVAIHYTKQGSEEIVTEVDRLGNDGLKSAEGMSAQIDRDAKTLTIRTADGVDQTFRLSERAVLDTGKDLDKNVDQSVKVTVYYLDLAGQKTAQFFKKMS